MQAEYKEYKNWGRVVAAITCLLLLLAFLLISWTVEDPPFEEEPLESIELDYRGGGSSSGSASKSDPTKTTSSENQPEDPVVTHDNPDSPVVKTNKPKKDGDSSNESEPTPDPVVKPKNDLNGLFGGNGDGDGKNDGNDKDDTGGDGGGIGPNIGVGTGSMGSARGAIYKPKVTDSYTETGTVVVMIYIKQDGKVDTNRTKVVDKSPDGKKVTTCTSDNNHKVAIRTANKFKFEASTTAKKLEYTYVTITFKKH